MCKYQEKKKNEVPPNFHTRPLSEHGGMLVSCDIIDKIWSILYMVGNSTQKTPLLVYYSCHSLALSNRRGANKRNRYIFLFCFIFWLIQCNRVL